MLTIGVSACTVISGGQDRADRILVQQARFIEAFNNRDYDSVVAEYHPSYRGLTSEHGFLSLRARQDMLKERFGSNDPGKITILETKVQFLGSHYALLNSRLKRMKSSGSVDNADDWWYTAIYIKSGTQWKIIFEQ